MWNFIWQKKSWDITIDNNAKWLLNKSMVLSNYQINEKILMIPNKPGNKTISGEIGLDKNMYLKESLIRSSAVILSTN